MPRLMFRRSSLILLSALSLAACGKGGTTGPALAATCGPAKLQISSGTGATGVATTFSAGTDLVALVRDTCPSPGAISGAISREPGVTPSGVRSYHWVLPRDYSAAELKALADQDACVTMLSDAKQDELKADASPLSSGIAIDPQVSRQSYLNSIGAFQSYSTFFNPRTGIRRDPRFDVVIAVVDSGVRLDHEDLRDRLWVNKGEIPANGIDDDHNGYIDDVYGYNFASHTSNPNPEESADNSAWQWAHGTKVAGLAAATAGNGRGGMGVAPNARIMALNNMGSAAFMDQSNTANAIRYAADNGASIINLSLGGDTGQTADYQQAIRYALSRGVVIFAAAGNEAMQIGSSYSAAGLAPSLPGLVSVGNFQAATFMKSPMSNYSSTFVKLGAPGTVDSVNLLYTTSPESPTSYAYFSGTSASTPVASGAAALAIGLIRARGYRYTPGDIEALLTQSARKVNALLGLFKDGNALDLAALARLIDQRYPARADGELASPPVAVNSGAPPVAGGCP